jgi:DNA-binding response OmpR family regulator
MNKKNVLVIEDTEIMRNYIKTILLEEGYNVMLAEDGEMGIQLLKTHTYDIVLTDIIMPVKEGVSTIREIRNFYPYVKVIAMSGADHKDNYLLTAFEFGADFFIYKPFTPEELLSTITLVEAQGQEKEIHHYHN